jgi:hypothetical protein
LIVPHIFAENEAIPALYIVFSTLSILFYPIRHLYPKPYIVWVYCIPKNSFKKNNKHIDNALNVWYIIGVGRITTNNRGGGQ